ncbi:branched-chain amino acid ABC transporter permease [Aureimonas glaciei]|uniref:Branched-chain amino acid ABC transporter permease n=1 Tax=Aureimonas glaciei TaxID=1776957 RepID=A0A916Y7J1_9HYPH|nr:branched-chain amino acid ABC transporter permease [Aureimonas glaciei]GGD33693.1 branched-chain amino acid ABC transporter permease [Aureimonas glaciei]
MEAYFLAIAIFVAIYTLLTLGLNLQYGLTGLTNFGVVGFFAIGAYASAILTTMGYPIVLGFAVGALLSIAAAWPIGLIALRLRDDYFAIATLGFSEVVRVVVISEQELTNGVQGIPGVPRLFAFAESRTLQPLLVLGTLLLVNLAVVLAMRRIVRSPFGRMIGAIRDNEEAVRALGKDPARFKTQVLMVGAGLAAVGGSFYAHYVGYVAPDQFIPLVTFQIWMAMILGGAGKISGAVVGTIVLMVILEGSRFLPDVFPFVSGAAMAEIRIFVVGLVLVLFTLYRPQGLMGDFTKR